MNVLMLSLDSSILDKNSISAGRMKNYGSICDELHIIVLGKSGKAEKLADNIFVYSTSEKRMLALITLFFKASKILQKEKDWIITCQDPFETGLIGWLLARKFKVGFEVQLHGDFYSNPYWKKERLLNGFRFYLGKFVLKRANSVRAVSERIKKSIGGFAKGKINKIPIYTEIKSFNYSAGKRKDYLTLLAVGNLVPVKNHKQLIGVFAEIKKELQNAKLIIVGDGPLKKSLQLYSFTALQLEKNIVFAGHRENLADYYNSADILIHPSLYEGWGRALIEAAHFGAPIIMTDVGLAGEVIKNEESGLVVPVNDKEALKNAIIRLAKDKELQKKLAQNAKKAVEEKMCTKEQYLEKIKENWKAILA
ncbi:glycosyltransferase family 4 protein [Patescibacteria group bacterium]|nr:glycosyltransferase family 4 protein [Patescibacteria group bacterium]